MSVKIYEYNRCGTCRNALKYLTAKGINFETVAIRETPPTIKELESMIKQTGDIKKLLNTSGVDYRSLNMKDKVKTHSEKEILKLLSQNGNLIKRPFVIYGDKGITGFKESDWDLFFN
jgi:arsenate reductase (glutaredoxin)